MVWFWLRMAWLFLVRSWRSTVVLAIMVFVAVAALVFLSALAVGTNDAMIRNSVSLFSGNIFCRGLAPNFDTKQLSADGVTGVCVRGHLPVQVGKGQKAQAMMLIGVNPVDETRLTALWRKTLAGRYLRPGASEIFISQDMAQQLNVTIGGQVQVSTEFGASSKVLTVCGIYQTNIASLDRGMAFCPEGALPSKPVERTAAVFLAPGVKPELVLSAYANLPGSGKCQAWTDFMPDLKQLIDLNVVSMNIVMVLVFGVVAIGISCAFIISILKNIREHGILKSMGLTPLETAILIFGQVGLLTLASALGGALLGMIISGVVGRFGIDLTAMTSHNQYFAVSGVIYPRLTTYSLGLPLLLAVFFGFLAAVWPVIFVVRTKAAEILRTAT